MELHQQLATLRKQHNLGQETLAETLGVSRQTVSKWESGMTRPSKRNLLRLSQVYSITLDELTQPQEKQPSEPQEIPEPPVEPDVSTVQETPNKKCLWLPIAATILLAVGIIFCVWLFGGNKEAVDANQESVSMDQIESEVAPPSTGFVPLLPLD